MKPGDLCKFLHPKTGEETIGTIESVPSSMMPGSGDTLMTVRDRGGKLHHFDAFLVYWEIIGDAGDQNAEGN